jgi:hypothetical protein
MVKKRMLSGLVRRITAAADWYRFRRPRMSAYDGRMRSTEGDVKPTRRPASAQDYEGLWVAMIGARVIEAGSTPHELALNLLRHEVDEREEAVIEFVQGPTPAILVGMG